MPTDTERLDWLERHGNGIGLVHDDEGAWAVGGDGMQSIRSTMPSDAPFDTTYIIDPDRFRPTVREAIDLAMADPDFALGGTDAG